LGGEGRICRIWIVKYGEGGKMKRILVVLLLVCLVVFVGCAAKRRVRVAPLYADDPYWAQVEKRPIDGIIVTEGDLRRKYTPIAKIFVESVGWKKEISFKRMKRECARIGADAVIKVKVSTQYVGQVENIATGKSFARNKHVLEGVAVIYED
jgi:hypothetical protein